MEFYTNTTRITEEGYIAIVRMKYQFQRLICRMAGFVVAIPFLQRCVYYLIMRFTTDKNFTLNIIDAVFTVLLLIAIFLWTLPRRRLKEYVQRTRDKVDLQAVNQYTFVTEGISMMTTSSLERYNLSYDDLTWIRSDKRWMVLYFGRQDFTMLVAKKGFTKGNANDCLNFLRDKMNGRR